jgi:hypothetical protein
MKQFLHTPSQREQGQFVVLYCENTESHNDMEPRKQYEKVPNFIYRCQTRTSFLALLMSSTTV